MSADGTDPAASLPGDFGFDDDARMLRDTARRFFADRVAEGERSRLVEGDPDPVRPPACTWNPDAWRQMAALGWTAVAVPEPHGGLGLGLIALEGLCEENGRAAYPSPLLATLCTTYALRACGDTEAAGGLLAEIAAGTAASLAICDRHGAPAWVRPSVELVEGRLRGTAHFVQDARKAGRLLVAAEGPEGLGLYVVHPDQPGVTIVPDRIADLTRDQAHVVLDDVEVGPGRVAAAPGLGAAALRAAEPAWLVLLAADMVGAAEWQLQTTAEYARTRVQFDKAIGAFQAVKHPLVDAMVAIDEARSLALHAACTFDHEPPPVGGTTPGGTDPESPAAEVAARMAKAAASDTAAVCSRRSVQLHGGIGFTWECQVHVYVKRQKHSEVLFGDAHHHRARLADAWIGRIGDLGDLGDLERLAS